MKKKDESGSAFPSDFFSHEGMTKREYFAGLALQGILANEGTPPPHGVMGIAGVEQDASNMALQAVLYADALIKRLAE